MRGRTAEATQVAEPETAARRSGARKKKSDGIRESIESLLVTVILALYGTSFVVQAFKIPSQSMEPTLMVGDHLLVNKFVFGGRGAWYDRFLPYRDIRRGDIIVFKFPYDDHSHYVKRVIGLPADRIKIVDQKLYVNEKLQPEPYVVHDPAMLDFFGNNFPPADVYSVQRAVRPEWAEQIFRSIRGGELIVPPDHYFVMGDNRDHSWDSRYWGFVDRDAIMGRPVVIYWSITTSSGEPSGSLLSRLLGLGDAIVHLPSRTRWRRMLHEVH